MATTNIGQYRYAGEGLTELAFKKSYVDSNADITGLDEQNTGFKDVAIIPNKQFVKGQDYYLKVQIPQDMNYAMEFTIKLTKIQIQTKARISILRPLTLTQVETGVTFITLHYMRKVMVALML